MGSPFPTIACSIKGKKRPGMAIGHSLTELGPARIGDRLRDEGGLACLGTRGGCPTVEVKAVDVDEPPVRQRVFRQSYVLPLVCHSVRGSNRSLARKNKIIRYANLVLFFFFCFRLSLDTVP